MQIKLLINIINLKFKKKINNKQNKLNKNNSI